MPQLVRTPEQILRDTKRDLYLIEFHEAQPFGNEFYSPFEPRIVTARAEVEQWFAENLADTELESLGPSEASGVMSGGCDWIMRVDFDEPSLKRFVAVWESPAGSCKDKCWTCYVWRYEDFLRTKPYADGPPVPDP